MVVCHPLLRNLFMIQRIESVTSEQPTRVDWAGWLLDHVGGDTLVWIIKSLGFFSFPALVLFLLLLGPRLPRGRLARSLLFGTGMASAIAAFVALGSPGALSLAMQVTLPDLLFSAAFHLVAAAFLGKIITPDDQHRPLRILSWLLLGYSVLATLCILCGWALFFLSGSLLLSPRLAWCNDTYNLVFAVLFVTANLLLGIRVMSRWKWQAIGAMSGCIIYTHVTLQEGGVYFSLLG